MTALVSIEELTIRPVDQPHLKLVNDVSFAIQAGKTTCVVGESGSGKSLTALAVMGLLSKQLQRKHGKILFQGQDLTHLSAEKMREIRGRQIGMIFQEPMTSLNPVLTVGFQIAEAVQLHRACSKDEAWKEAVRMLDLVEIPDAASRATSGPSPAPRRARAWPDADAAGARLRVACAALCARP